MFAIDWTDMSVYPWVAAAGGGVLLLAVAAYFLPLGKMKVPAAVVAAVAGLGTGLALGVVLMGSFGYRIEKPASEGEQEGQEDQQARMMAMKGKGMGKGGMFGGGKGMWGGKGGKGKWGGKGGGFRPQPQAQLVSLVAKMDLLTGKQPTLELDDEQRKKVSEQLQGLDELDDLSEEEASKRLQAILEVVKDQKAALTAVGFAWPGGGGGGGRGKGAKTLKFTEAPARDQLRALEKRLAVMADPGP